MTRFHVLTDAARPGLHVWRESQSEPRLRLYLTPAAHAQNGWVTFEAELDPTNLSPIGFMLFEWNNHNASHYENEVFKRELPRTDGFPADVWFFQDSNVVCLTDPATVSHANVRIHLITAHRYRNGLLYLWQKSGPGEELLPAGMDPSGPYWDVALNGERRHYFNFKFLSRGHIQWEATSTNRTWTALAGREIWVKSEVPDVASTQPQRKEMRLHLLQDASFSAPQVELSQDGSDFWTLLETYADESNPGWLVCKYSIYTGLDYRAQLVWSDLNGQVMREHPEVRRHLRIEAEVDLWALEGESRVLPSKPSQDLEVTVKVLSRPPDGRFNGQMFAHVWIDRALRPIHRMLPIDASGEVRFKTYRDLTTSIKFHTQANWETIDRHVLYPADAAREEPVYVTLDRFEILTSEPPRDIYKNPDWEIRRPGVYQEGDQLRFVLHAPKAARVRLWGQWMGTGKPVDLLMMEDRTFWWTSLPVSQVNSGLSSGDFHGAEYHYLIDNDRRLQDPAAGWVVHSGFDANSRLVRSIKFVWSDTPWRHPTWDHLILYQIHPQRFSGRGPGHLKPLERVKWEIENNAGYIRQLGATAILLLPVHEFAGDYSWGYNPAFYYAVESAYGGPDALKDLVDTCHRHGFAVLLDLVLNHSGNDNPLWELSRETFFDGDTKWGALINFDHPQCRYFFERCVAYLAGEYRVDGFRLDHTRTILHGDQWQDDIIKVRGSGGGWEFLKGLHRAARKEGGDGFIVVGEHLPNDWKVSYDGGPLDSQWNDNYHDRLEDVFRPWGSLSELADAFKITHTEAREWFHSTNYAESHDEVGNENDRIAHIAGYGRGLRAAKVHGAAVLLSRGIPMFFMGAESAEWRQFIQNSNETLPLDSYLRDPESQRVRYWWKVLCELRQNNPNFKGPAPLDVRFAQDRMLGFTRGNSGDYYVLLNFGSFFGHKPLAELNLPDGLYRELWNSTWDEFRNQSENEQLRHNGGRGAQLHRAYSLHIPDISAIILERI